MTATSWNDRRIRSHPVDPDVRARREIEDLAHLLDSQFRFPGTNRRFGVDAVLGLVPGIGDVAGLVLSGGVILKAIHLGARGATVVRMAMNVAVDAVVGSVPVLGWFFDFGFKANNRNVALLQRHVRDPAGTRAASRSAIRRTVLLAVVALVVAVVALVALVVWVLGLLF
jgi:hypothetical protein